MSKIDELIKAHCPDGIEYLRLGEVAQILNGYSFKSNKYSKSGIRVVRISDVQKGKMSNKDLKFYPLDSQHEISRFLLQESDLVMSLTGNVGRVAMLRKSDLPAALNQRVACIRPKESVLTKWLFHFFDTDTFESEAVKNSTGGGQKNMSTVWLSNYKIPIPPLEIQKEIVNILEKFTEIESNLSLELESRQIQYEYYRNQLLGFENPELPAVKLGDIAKYSNSRIASDELDHENYVGVDNLLQNRLGKTDSSYVPNEGKVIRYESGDVLIGNIRPYLKKIWYADRIGGTNGDVLVIHVKDNSKDKIESRYLYHSLSSDKFFEFNVQNSKGAKMPRGDKFSIMNFEIHLPPIEEQKRIISMLDTFEKLVYSPSESIDAEIKARRSQYEYYRTQLLTFKELPI